MKKRSIIFKKNSKDKAILVKRSTSGEMCTAFNIFEREEVVVKYNIEKIF